MASLGCPTLGHYDQSDDCLEQYGGVGDVVYAFDPADLDSEPVLNTDGSYAGYEGLTFASGKGAFRIDCKEDVNIVTAQSNGKKKAFTTTLKLTIDGNNNKTALLMRALNNLSLGFVVPDGDDYVILYNPQRKNKIDSGGIENTTGDTADSDRTTTVTVTSVNVYGPMRLKGPLTIAD